MSTLGRGSIPSADLGPMSRLTRRTTLLRLALALALVVAAAAAVLVAARQIPERRAFLPPGSNAIIVLDLSASISADTYARIGTTLERLSRSDGRYGLVLFSDTAYEALPPGSPATELRAFQRFFSPRPHSSGGALPGPAINPWTRSFSAGTRISAGLQSALDRIVADGLSETSVLLVSDLDDDTNDLGRLATLASAYRARGVAVRVVGLNPSPEDVRNIEELLPVNGSVSQADLLGERTIAISARLALWLLAVAVIVALLAAMRELLLPPLRWSER